MKQKTLMSWSSGKDSAWALYQLQQNPDVDLIGMFCTVNREFDRVAMHGVRVELLKMQADSIGLPLHIIEIPNPCSHDEYSEIMAEFVSGAREQGVDCFAFGDLFLEDIRHYREEKLEGTGIKPIFPIWGIPTEELSQMMLNSGLKTVITCVDSKQISESFAGREYDSDFINDLPTSADPCGENGEFHSFVFDGPMFNSKIDIRVGEIVHRDQFVFADLLPAE